MAKTKKRPEAKALPGTPGRPAPRAPTKRDLGIAEGEARASRILLKTDSKTLIRLPHGEALKIVFANALADGEGESSGAVGSMRFGKTYWLQEVLQEGFANGTWSRAFVHDVKKIDPQYEGKVCAGVDDYLARSAEFEAERVTVFHHPDFRLRPSLQDVCDVALLNAESGESVVVVADEVYKGTNGYGNWLQGPVELNTGKPAPALFPLFVREGTSQKISDLWSTQIPQQLPTELKVLSRTIAQFHLEGLAAEAACDHFRLTGKGEELLASLGRGEFVLFCQNQNWNRTVYVPDER